jgi:hypothetical protein
LHKYNDNDTIFVYGTKINDLYKINRSYLAMLSIGGIQELTKMLYELENEQKILLDIYNNHNIYIETINNDINELLNLI